ncbi:MAG: hypothetical protein P8P74_06105 [Crocinitomicaceae bacterium]|nr:hypothetical protein [Crocinitomicaceae bacterium]
MEKKKKGILKSGLMETKMDFTSNLMDRIDAEEKALSNVLSKSNAMETSDDFTAQLMLKLEGKVPAKPYKSIISKRAWTGIAAVFVGIIVLSLLTIGQEGGSLKYDLEIEEATNTFVSFFQNSPGFTYSSLGLLVLTFGLWVEQRSKKTA